MVLLLFIVLIHILLLSRLIFFPYPELFIYPYLTKIGLIPYKQIFDQHFPGIMFFPVNLATLGIDSPQEMRMLQYLMIALSHIFLYFISKNLFRSEKKAIYVNIIFLICQPFFEGNVLWIESFATPLVLGSFYLLIMFLERKQGHYLFLSGMVLGVSLLFKQVTLPLIIFSVIYVYFGFNKIRSVERYLLGLMVPCAYLIYFIYKSKIISEFVYWTITFNLTIFAEMGRKYPGFADIIKFGIFFGIPLITIIFFFVKKRFDKKTVLVSGYFISCLFFAFARIDLIHFQPAIPFAAILIAYYFTEIRGKLKYIIILIFLCSTLIVSLRQYLLLYGDGVVFYGEREKEISDKVLSYAKPGDSVFSFGSLPHIYQMTATVPPGRIFVFQFPWFVKENEDVILKGIEIDPPKVIIRDAGSEVAGINLSRYMGKIDDHITKYYKTTDRVGEVDIMIPN